MRESRDRRWRSCLFSCAPCGGGCERIRLGGGDQARLWGASHREGTGNYNSGSSKDEPDSCGFCEPRGPDWEWDGGRRARRREVDDPEEESEL